MPAILGILFTFLLGSTIAQQFSDYFFDYDIKGYTTECKAALNETLQYSSLLASIKSEDIKLSKDDLTELYTSECRSSLTERQKAIQKACPISTNKVDGDNSTAQDNINIFLDTFTKTYFTDPYYIFHSPNIYLLLIKVFRKIKDFYYNIIQL